MTIHCKSLLLSCKNRTQNFPTIIIPLEKLLVTLSPATYITVMALGDYRRMDQRTWDSSCSTRLVCRWVQDQGGDWGWSLWAICGKKAQFFSRKVCHSFQAEIYAILACAHEIRFQGRPEQHVSICSDSQVALKALQAFRTTFPLVQ